MGALTRSRVLLDAVAHTAHDDANTVVFTLNDPEWFGENIRLAMRAERWFDLGRPAQITVTIHPGDELNDPTTA